ncbi:hypothetical protein HQQ80_10195 [Microbacteriaceae bacterium VKM Ac-2855]|nr:hypothetical protein [Microbacteriaceae bacterium VKM Ac-2855]
MRASRRTTLIVSYLGISLVGWLFFGVILRMQLDLIGVTKPDALGIVLLVLFGLILSMGTSIGYATIRRATWDRAHDGGHRS